MGESTAKINKSAGQRLEQRDKQMNLEQGLEQKLEQRPNEGRKAVCPLLLVHCLSILVA